MDQLDGLQTLLEIVVLVTTLALQNPPMACLVGLVAVVALIVDQQDEGEDPE
jgi:hypothetical protein